MAQLDGLDNIAGYERIYLSPHLDDAALSCGGAIAAGGRSLVVTLCTAAPPPGTRFNAVAVEFHAEWGLPPEAVVSARHAEDAAAMAILGCDYTYAGMLDAIYRLPDEYRSRATLYRPPVPDDPLGPPLRELIAGLRRAAPRATIVAPLGVGDHVDHLVTLAAALAAAGPGLRLYDDINYALQPGAVEERVAAAGLPLTPQVVPLDAAALRAKVAAIAAYASQLDALFGGAAAMEQAITAYHAALAPDGAPYGERVWRLDQ